MAKTFEAQVEAFVAKSKRRMKAVVQTATQDAIKAMQKPRAKGGNMPVDTGFLRNSIVTSLNGGRPEGRPGTNAELGLGKNPEAHESEPYILALAGYSLGDTILVGYTANYAVHQEYGTASLPGRAFREKAARRWPSFVAKAAVRARTIP